MIGTVHPPGSAATGLPVGTPVMAGTIDVFAEAFSVGVRRPGDLMIMYGSTIFCAQVLADYYAHPDLWTIVGVEPGTLALAGGTATAGILTSWLRDLMGEADFTTLAEEAARIPLGSEGLLVLPYLAGERTPVLDPEARGLVAGLTLRHTRAHLFRGAYEGIAFGIRQMLDLFDQSTTPALRTIAVGGGVLSPLWTSITTDVIGRSQLIPRYTIGASYEDALLAAIGVGLVDPDTDWTVIDHKVEPDPERQARYETLYPLWRELYPGTRDQMHRMGAWARADLPDLSEPS